MLEHSRLLATMKFYEILISFQTFYDLKSIFLKNNDYRKRRRVERVAR